MAKYSSGPNYSSYVEAYKRKAQILSKKGMSMYDTMFTKSEFEFAYKIERDAMVKLVREGKRKVVGNITQNLVSEQSYEKSLSQARSLSFAYKNLGFNVSPSQIRLNRGEANQALEALKSKYIEARDNSDIDNAGEYIAIEYFGS